MAQDKLHKTNKSGIPDLLFQPSLPSARWAKITPARSHNSNALLFVLNGPKLAKILEFDQAQKWELMAKL